MNITAKILNKILVYQVQQNIKNNMDNMIHATNSNIFKVLITNDKVISQTIINI